MAKLKNGYHCPTCGELPHWDAVVAANRDGCPPYGPRYCAHCHAEYIMHVTTKCHGSVAAVALSPAFCPKAADLDAMIGGLRKRALTALAIASPGSLS